MASILYDFYERFSKHPFGSSLEYYDTHRKQLEPVIFEILQSRYGEIFEERWKTATIPKWGETDKTILFVERRQHPNFRFLLRNVAYFCPDWSITVVCSDENLEFVKECCEPHGGHIRVLPLMKGASDPVTGRREYNELLQTETFWSLFQEEWVLTMEMDCYLRKPLPTEIFQYDYVASMWHWNKKAPGGGGLSLRRVRMMKELCADRTVRKDSAQDCFVSNALEQPDSSWTWPSQEKNLYFGESCIEKQTCGVHQWWTFFGQHWTNLTSPSDILLTLEVLLSCEM